MYINKIDDLLDKIIDDFYNTVILKDSTFKKILGDTNFIKYQDQLSDVMEKYIKSINIREIRDILHNEDNVSIIIKIVKRYIAYYLFLTLSFFYTGKNETFINNVIEFSKNQGTRTFKIEDFFNSENNANIIKFHHLLKNILIILDTPESKIANLSHKQDFKDTFDFLNDLGQEYVESVFTLKSVQNKVSEQSHNIIKTIIILQIYRKEEKKEVFRLLELVEQEKGEYMFIDVVVPKRQYIDFSSIEEILTPMEIRDGLAHELWDYLLKQEESSVSFETMDDKILRLINSGYIVPITEDFLLYHKDTERYDKNMTEQAKKKKEDTKIRYIINKIDTFSELYSVNDPKIKQNIKKLLYMPMIDRRAILHNGIEEIKIINKLINQGKRSIENNEHYNDLINYRSYPYISFKDFRKAGFSIILNKTIDAVRSISFDKGGDFKQNERNELQVRVGSKDLPVNIVGFIIPTNHMPLECVKIRDVIDIRTIDKNNKNGYQLFLKYLELTKLQQKKHKSSVFWLFNLDTDDAKIDTYEQTTKLTNQDQVRHFISNMYEDILQIVYRLISNDLDNITDLQIDTAYELIYRLQKKLIRLPNGSDLLVALENKIFSEKAKKITPVYDIQDDVFNGISGDIIKLKVIEKQKEPKIPTINIKLSSAEKITQRQFDESINAICQHNISWNYVSALRKKDPNKHSDMLHEFVQQYVIENNEQDYVCKSCGFQINIKKYIIDGKFDDETQKFVVFSMPMDVPLEDIPEYEKYKASIRNIEKIIERIASILNIPYFTGTSNSVKWKRKSVTKNVIDIVLANNKLLKDNFKERNEMAVKLYGISRELSNLFIFDLDNTIFVYSSKEKDYYRLIKHNNMIIYILIMIILELNETHIGFLFGDKKGLCNFGVFEKYGQVLFEGLKIRKNMSGDLVPIKNYKLLCYILYLTSCMSTKYNLWYYEKAADKKKFNPVIQKIIIHTTIDIFNSILENSAKKNIPHVYESVSVKFYSKLQSLYANKQVLDKLRSADVDQFSVSDDKKMFIVTKFKPIELTGSYIPMELLETIYAEKRLPKYFTATKKYIDTQKVMTNVTNCPDGNFHKWLTKGKSFVCSLCSQETATIKYDTEKTNTIQNKFKYVELKKIASKLCNDGTLHNFIYDSDNKCNVCKKCKNTDKYDFTEAELEQMNKNIIKAVETLNYAENKEIVEENDKNKKYNEYTDKVLKKIQDNFNKVNTRENPLKFIQDFINIIQTVIGTEANTGSMTIYLSDNSYIIDHDYLGYPLEKPITLTDKDNKITFKQSHPFFKTDVLFYSDTRTAKIDVFYDAISNILLGYKESNKDYVSLKRPDRKILVIYSLQNRLAYMGYESQFINLKDKAALYDDIDQDNVIAHIVKDLIRNRIKNLKKVIYEFQKFIYRVKYNYTDTVKYVKPEEKSHDKHNMIEEEPNVILLTIEKYQKKLQNLVTVDDKGDHKIFRHWKAVSTSLFSESLSDRSINLDLRLVHIDDINRYDANGNLLLFYIVTELQKLIEYNTSKFTRSYVVYFLIDFINILFDMFNCEYISSTFDIKRFEYILKSSGYIHDLEQKGHGLDDFTTGVYSEVKDPDEEETEEQKEQKYDDEEEAEAIDALPEDIDAEYESAYNRNFDDYETMFQEKSSLWEVAE